MPNGCGKLCPFLASILVDRAGEADVHVGITLGKQGDEIIIRGDLVLVIEIEWYCRFTVFSCLWFASTCVNRTLRMSGGLADFSTDA